LAKQQGTLLHVTFTGTEIGESPEIESWLESLEWSCFLTMSKNGSINLIVGYVISYDCCFHHRVDANELFTNML
jgi:hypothetical protein